MNVYSGAAPHVYSAEETRCAGIRLWNKETCFPGMRVNGNVEGFVSSRRGGLDVISQMSGELGVVAFALLRSTLDTSGAVLWEFDVGDATHCLSGGIVDCAVIWLTYVAVAIGIDRALRQRAD
jgi:hypothetical protein